MGRQVWAPTVSGPLAPFAAGFESWLVARGYSRSAVGHRLWQFDQLSRWLEREGLGAGELEPERAEQFARARRAAGYVTWVSPRSVVLPLEYLREVGVVPAAAAPIVAGALEELLGAYCRYLLCERGLSEHTVHARYGPVAELFLSGRQGPGGLGLERMTAADVSLFLARECPARSVPTAKDLVVALRCLLRYLHVAGLISSPLQWAVPGVAGGRGGELPHGLEHAAVARLLASCDRRRTVGRRDYAILLLLVRLGLRAGEVAALQLDDVDWRCGQILIRGKGDRHERLPLPADVGEALVGYLRRRGRDQCRAVFLRVVAPRGAIRSSAVSGVVREACARAGLPSVGAHTLRHTAATELLRAGASLPEIAQLLRHHTIGATAIYAKVDRAALRPLALPWPGGDA